MLRRRVQRPIHCRPLGVTHRPLLGTERRGGGRPSPSAVRVLAWLPMSFLKVSKEALMLCPGTGERMVVLWLFEQGDLWGWGEVFDAPTTYLCSLSGHRRGWATGFLQRLQRARILEIVEAGGSRKTRSVRVFDPGLRAEQLGERSRERSRERSNGASMPNVAQSGTAPGTATGTATGTPYDLETKTKKKTETKKAPQPPSQRDQDIAAAWEAYRAHHPRAGAKPPKTVRSKISKLLDDYELEGVIRGVDNQHAPDSWWVERGVTAASVIFKLEGFDRKMDLDQETPRREPADYEPPEEPLWLSDHPDYVEPNA